MNWVDIVIGVILILAFFSGFKKGLFVALASLVGIVAGVLGAIYFSDFAGSYISRWFDWGDQFTKWASFAVTFAAIVLLVSMAGKFLTKIADFAMLGLLNKLLGGVFAVLQYAFILSVIFMFLEGYSGTGYVISEEKKSGSKLYQPIAKIAPMILPNVMAKFKSEVIDQETTEEETSEN